ncbi:cell differentiation protein rcd1-like [Cornus florida]|uniref:cell differentiation protein rcd1-like n=1 Tax=Cornus florida TaxID=4283 RepID=UPI00289DF81F|nr:cell differentiation protein rcd1-like [Cornus florida]
MSSLPESLNVDSSGAAAGPSSSRGATNRIRADLKSASVDDLILLLRESEYREDALFFLNKKRETVGDLALLLWNSFNTIYILLKEVLDVYKLLIPSKLTTRDSNRVCDALALLQCVASHQETKMPFIKAKIPIYLYPFLNFKESEKPFEFLRLTSLGVIGALVKVDDPQVIHFLLETEIFPLCLRCMEWGDDLSKTVATFIVAKILLQEEGLSYCCSFAERFYAVAQVLEGMMEKLAEKPSTRLQKNIIRCYLRLSEFPRACDALRRNFPARLRDTTFINILCEDQITKRYLQQLFYNVMAGPRPRPEVAGDASGHFTRG